jgi:hypothetical protein
MHQSLKRFAYVSGVAIENASNERHRKSKRFDPEIVDRQFGDRCLRIAA